MPTVEWNKSWANNLRMFEKGELKGEHYGDQWGDPSKDPLLTSVVERFVIPFVNESTSALEIGSGGGRWTQFLLSCKLVYCVELNPEMFKYLKKRFGKSKNLKYIRTNGSDFPTVPIDSIDFVFSFGTLVHLDVEIIESYISNLRKIVRPHCNLCLQFSNKSKPLARDNPDFSENNPDTMTHLLENHDFHVMHIDDETLPHSSIVHAINIESYS
jgi:SAM-dependent methyltransferase